MKLDIEVDDDGVIIKTKFKTFGCGSGIVLSSKRMDQRKNAGRRAKNYQ